MNALGFFVCVVGVSACISSLSAHPALGSPIQVMPIATTWFLLGLSFWGGKKSIKKKVKLKAAARLGDINMT